MVEIIKDSNPVDKSKLDPQKVGPLTISPRSYIERVCKYCLRGGELGQVLSLRRFLCIQNQGDWGSRFKAFEPRGTRNSGWSCGVRCGPRLLPD